METECHYLFIILIQLLASFLISPVLFPGISLILLVIAMLAAGAEEAVLALNPSIIEKLEVREDAKSKIITRFIKQPDKFHLTVSLANIFISVIVFILLLPLLLGNNSIPGNDILFAVLIIIGFAILMILFTEFLPRFFAHQEEPFLYFMAYPLKVIEVLFTPLTYIIIGLTNTYSKRFLGHKHDISIEDISNALELTVDAHSNEGDILKGIVNFGNIDVRQILKPSIDVVAVDNEIDSDELYKTIVDSGYSRIPVYSETFDNIIGILYVKDLLPHFRDLNEFNWQSVIRAPYLVPETKKVKELLKEFQENKVQMAVVIDEYGGTTGIVTMEDVLEEIVGEIADESDEDEQVFTRIDDHTFLFDGITLLADFCNITNCNDDLFDEVKGDADTLAGLILQLKGEIPENGDEIRFDRFLFVIELVNNRRIKKVKVSIQPEEMEVDE